MRYSLTATILVLLFVSAGVVSAQSLGSADPFTLSISPRYPVPFSQATLSFLSSTLNLSNATLTVSAGGKQIYQGSVQPVTITVGKVGGVVPLSITISSAGTDYKKSLVIQPQDVSLIAEPLSSSPPLYLGKTLVPVGGSVRVVAIAGLQDAGGKVIDPSTLSYRWTVDNTQIADSSGIGKNVIVVSSPIQYRGRSVSVIVQSQSGDLVGSDTLSIAAVEPTVRIYENDPLLGIRFDHALSDTYTINRSEASLYAAPFSFPLAGGSPLIQWLLNGASAQVGNLITLRPSGTGQGDASLSLMVSSGGFARATATLSLSFGTKQTTNFFGL